MLSIFEPVFEICLYKKNMYSLSNSQIFYTATANTKKQLFFLVMKFY